MTIQSRLKTTKIIIFILAVVVFLSIVYPVVFGVSAPAIEKSLNPITPDGQIDFFKAIIGGLVCIVSFFFVRTLTGFDNNNRAQIEWMKEIQKDHNGLRSDFDRLKGEHDGRVYCHVRKDDE